MKKLVSLLLAVALLVSVFSTLAVAEEKVTVSLLTTRNSTATNDIEDVWFFKYLAQKMNVDFELEQTLETDQRISLMFASDSVPDLVWGIGLMRPSWRRSSNAQLTTAAGDSPIQASPAVFMNTEVASCFGCLTEPGVQPYASRQVKPAALLWRWEIFAMTSVA